MKINTKATNITLTPAISEYIEKKLAMLDKFFQENEEVMVNVEVGKTTRHHKSGDVFKAEIHILSGGEDYYAVTETEDLYAAIDEAKDDVARSLTSKKKKALRLFRRGGAHLKNLMRGLVNIKDKSWNRLKRFKYKK